MKVITNFEYTGNAVKITFSYRGKDSVTISGLIEADLTDLDGLKEISSTVIPAVEAIIQKISNQQTITAIRGAVDDMKSTPEPPKLKPESPEKQDTKTNKEIP